MTENIPGYVIPFMEVPEGVTPLRVGDNPHSIMVDGCDYEIAIAETPIGKVPVLTFNFHSSQGLKVAPIILMMDKSYLQAFKQDLVLAINAAIRKAEKHGV